MLALSPKSIPTMKTLEETYLRLKTNDETLTNVVIDFKSRGFQVDLIFPEKALKLFSSVVKKNTVMTHLTIRNLTLSQTSASLLADVLAGSTSTSSMLTCFALKDVRCTEDVSLQIIEALQTNTALQRLNLCAIGMNSAGAASLAKVLETNPSLHELRLSHNTMDAKAARVFSRGLQTTTSLKTLDLENNAINDLSVARLAQGLQRNTSLTHLGLDFNAFGIDGVTALAQLLRTNTTLQELSLFGNHIDAHGAQQIADSLQEHNRSLQSLVLSFNNIGDDGATALARALTVNSTLVKLCLSANGLTHVSIRAIGICLPAMDGLRELNLGDTATPSALADHNAAACLLRGLESNVVLEKLLLESSVLLDNNERSNIAGQIEWLLNANRTGARRLLRNDDTIPVDLGVWPLVMERANRQDSHANKKGDDPNGLYYICREKPDLFSHASRPV